MTFNHIIWKMAKVQYKKYLFYFLCNSFAVMFFFMFSTVYFNERIVEAKKLEGIQDALAIPGVALVVFTIFFISYAHNVFMKKRKSEFGLFMTLGMSHRDISKLLLLENGIIGILSIISGLVGGTIFSRLFFLLLMNSVGLKEIPFHFKSNMFIYSIGAFAIVFLTAVGKSLFFTLKRDVIQSIRSNRTAETIKLKSPLFGGLGLAIMIGSIAMLYQTYSNATGAYLLLWTLAVLMGLYISLYQSVSFFIELAKKSKPFYYRRLVLLTNLDYKFKQLTSILMLVTVMIMVTIIYTTLLLTIYKSAEKDALNQNPYDIAFLQTETKNNLSVDKINSIIDQKEHPLKEHLEIPIYYSIQKLTGVDGYFTNVIMSVEDFNQLTGQQKSLQDKEYINYINEDPEYVETDDIKYDLPFDIGNEERVYKETETIAAKTINSLSYLHEFIIVSNDEFELLKQNVNGFAGKVHLIKVTNWKNTSDVVEELDKQFKSYNDSTAAITDTLDKFTSEEELLQIASKVMDYYSNKNSSGIMFFVISFLSVIFFFGTFILLYLNLFSDMDQEKAKYKKLYKIGITVKEVRGIISRELATLFFLPTILGTTIAFLYVAILATDVGGIMKNPEILEHFSIVSGVYLCIQAGYFLYARKKMSFYLTEETS
ncbi:ABC transporter permease [Neobacillus mesonae]|uniref:ABC transporter permease n=1 Tax=Neobacillus mesonae TaxID=1193713 RepID=UPI002E231C62|nr:FtsX-like permease family protein [Neobacillus mesonae]MED4206411.1 FtsX-like permease family protein [Neobacillus mesonae]